MKSVLNKISTQVSEQMIASARMLKRSFLDGASEDDIIKFINNMENKYLSNELNYFIDRSSETICTNGIIAFGHYDDHPFATYNIATGEVKEYNW